MGIRQGNEDMVINRGLGGKELQGSDALQPGDGKGRAGGEGLGR